METDNNKTDNKKTLFVTCLTADGGRYDADAVVDEGEVYKIPVRAGCVEIYATVIDGARELPKVEPNMASENHAKKLKHLARAELCDKIVESGGFVDKDALAARAA